MGTYTEYGDHVKTSLASGSIPGLKSTSLLSILLVISTSDLSFLIVPAEVLRVESLAWNCIVSKDDQKFKIGIN